MLAALVFAGFLAVLPRLLRSAKRSRRKADTGGAVLAFGLAFMAIFDPGKSAAVEEVQKRKDLGEAERSESCGDDPSGEA